MEIKLEKICEPKNLEIGQRYSLSEHALYHFVFTVEYKNDHFVIVKYSDNITGSFDIFESHLPIYEFPYSSLEKELL